MQSDGAERRKKNFKQFKYMVKSLKSYYTHPEENYMVNLRKNRFLD